MSHVDFIEKLLNGVNVEWLPLGDVTKYEQPTKYLVAAKNYNAQFKTPVLTAGKTFVLGYTDEVDGIYKASENPVIIFDDFTTAHKWVDFDFKAKSSAMKMITSSNESKTLLKYIYYWLNTLPSELVDGDHKRQWIGNYASKIIPIPCPDNPKKSLKIQAEIVRILDTFTELTNELTNELTARKKQYNHYRDQLLSFEDGEVEWKTLPEMAIDFGRGKSKHRPRNDERLYGGDVPFIQTGDIRNAAHIIMAHSQTYSDFGLQQSKLWPKGTLCITIAANIAETSILGFDACFPDSVIGFVADPEKTTSAYVEYLLQSTKRKLEEKGREKSSAQSNINLGTFEALKLPFPPLAEQARIVAILDKFDALTTSLTEGLPREIELRQKQYAYYRDLLLSFPKQEGVEV
ncbi:restriction endonuclease subunit S [Aeromonas rivipollensis]|uniref:Restriction endonuclease subunit S n=1 Tax=Aeromonas rivipollensis TaxID=948519 RepID=A0ABX0CZM6_9GAMM|nr:MULTISPECIES: restriction endonuclease subunit S [Aeromonas]NEX89416.1 restriction endonuclease subunit S [Aeromonas rivipollensis]NEY06564.1 restriction endonuclease subunit S [Aeromonas rivipollensis]WEA31268.1 restriction endonuclease subunit S [Aeromonas hydrophila]